MEFKDGDVIQVNGNPCRIEGGALVPVVKRGPLGGFVKRLGDCGLDQYVGIIGRASDLIDFLPGDYLVEVHVPPRPTFTPTTAGEAIIDGQIKKRQWVAVCVKHVNSTYNTMQIAEDSYLNGCDEILLIEGADLP